MFETEARGTTWTRTSSHKGKRAETVSVGCFVIEHIATGKVVTGSSSSMNLDIDKIITDIDSGKHSNKKFRKPCELDSDLKVYEYPCKTINAAKKLEKEIRRGVSPDYLLVN
jgi:hypothetical protein